MGDGAAGPPCLVQAQGSACVSPHACPWWPLLSFLSRPLFHLRLSRHCCSRRNVASPQLATLDLQEPTPFLSTQGPGCSFPRMHGSISPGALAGAQGAEDAGMAFSLGLVPPPSCKGDPRRCQIPGLLARHLGGRSQPLAPHCPSPPLALQASGLPKDLPPWTQEGWTGGFLTSKRLAPAGMSSAKAGSPWRHPCPSQALLEPGSLRRCRGWG